MAAYAHGFVVAIIGPTGKPIKEVNEVGTRTVRLPFDSEYKLRIKNNNHKRAKARVFIDGMDITPGRTFVLNANQELDLERFVVDGDLNKGNRFRFVNKEKGASTGEIQDPNSHQLGLVEVKFYREVDSPWWSNVTFTSTPPPPPGGWMYGAGGSGLTFNSADNLEKYKNDSGGSLNTLRGMNIGTSDPNFHGGPGMPISGSAICTNDLPLTSAYHVSGDRLIQPDEASTGLGDTPSLHPLQSEAGGTAMGSESNQKFHESFFTFPTVDSPITISIQLKGLKQPTVAENPKQPLSPGSFVILDVHGNMLGLVERAAIFLEANRHFIEIEITRKVAGAHESFKERSIVSEMCFDQHKYQAGQKVMVVKLATPVSEPTMLAFGAP